MPIEYAIYLIVRAPATFHDFVKFADHDKLEKRGSSRDPLYRLRLCQRPAVAGSPVRRPIGEGLRRGLDRDGDAVLAASGPQTRRKPGRFANDLPSASPFEKG